MIFVKITKQINKFTAEIASWVVFLMMLLSVADAVGRYVFKVTVFGAQDITQLMMVIVVFLGFGLLAEEDGNVRIEILYQHFSPKLKAVANIFAWIVGIAAYSMVLQLISNIILNAMTLAGKGDAAGLIEGEGSAK